MTAKDLRRLAGQVFADLGRARVTPREALVFEQLIRVTLGRGRQSVRIVRREVWGRFGLSKGNVSDVLNGLPGGSSGLIALGMVQVAPHAEGGELWSVLPDAAQWRCGWRFERLAQAEFLADLDAVAGQVQGELLPREPDLADALALVSLENAEGVPESGTTFRPVPDLGTVAVPLRVSEFSSSKPCTRLLTPELSKRGEEPRPRDIPAQRTSQVVDRPKGKPLSREMEGALVERCREVFGELTMVNWGGAWRNRVREDAAKVARVLAETESEMKGRVVANPGGFANDLWWRFK